jgi:SagB-type dehydrogenase family enzyme
MAMLRIQPVIALLIMTGALCWSSSATAIKQEIKARKKMELPAPSHTSDVSLESAIQARRSVRSFSPRSPSLTDMAQLLWAAQGITSRHRLRAAPSAGALYPLEIYLVAGGINDLDSGAYRYVPATHSLELIKMGDLRSELSSASLGQRSIAQAPVCLVTTAVFQRTANKYGTRSDRYVLIEAGHAGQNILLQAVTRGLGAVVIGAFDDRAVQKVLDLPADHEPISIIPTGFPVFKLTGD